MQTVMSYDAAGRKVVVYRVRLGDGSFVEVDADLADVSREGPEAFVAKEVELHERALGLKR